MKITKIVLLVSAAMLVVPAQAQQSSAPAAAAAKPQAPAWVEKSNAYTMELIAMQAKYSPEGFSATGYEQYDGLVSDAGPNLSKRYIADAEKLIARFKTALATEQDQNVRQDLQILIDSIDQSIAGTKLGDQYSLDYYNVPQSIFGSISSLLQDQVQAERRKKAVELLQRYTGLYEGTEAYTKLAKDRFNESIADGKFGPYRVQVEEQLGQYDTFAKGVRELFTKYEIAGAEAALDAMDEQFADYGAWVRSDVLPRARTEARLPEPLYAYQLRTVGIDIEPAQAMSEARRGFYELRAQMQALAPVVAAKFGMSVTDYPSVIRELKKKPISNDVIEDHYRKVNAELERIIREKEIVSLPNYEMLMRLASPAESAAQPAPHMRPPRLIGNTGERGQFVLTTGNPSAGEGEAYDDFNFEAVAWTLSAHEARPGHEMQFAELVRQGVSLARMLYSFNSVNVEGWALYAEAEMMPHEPVEGQMFALQFRLLRAARAFLDPMLNLGMITRDEAERVLLEEVMLSKPMAKQELDRYQFRMPGQAGSYYYGFRKLIDLRMEVETAMGNKFNQKEFNDFLLSQGIIPLDLIAQATRERFLGKKAN